MRAEQKREKIQWLHRQALKQPPLLPTVEVDGNVERCVALVVLHVKLNARLIE